MDDENHPFKDTSNIFFNNIVFAFFKQSVIIKLHLIKSDGGTSPLKSHQPIKLGGNARAIR